MISCARINSNTLRTLTERYHISEDTLKTIIHKYWMQNGTEDYFPSDIYISAELGRGQYAESSDAIIELWEKNYSKPVEIEEKDLKTAKEEALKYFPDSVIKVYQNNKGTYSIAVKKPVKHLSNSIKTFLDKKTYSSQEYADYKSVTGKDAEEYPIEDKYKPQTFTFNDGVSVKAPFRLNYQQEEALNAMDEFVKSDRTSMTLSGYAGTGKTSIMEMLAQKMKQQHRNIIFSASTNKAAAVLRDRVQKAGFTAQTLNKVFGISVEVDESKPYDASNLVIKLKDSNIRPGTVVVIDEASMINEENYKILNDIAKQFNLKIIYVGDEAQLAPVNESKISKVFRDSMNDVKRLTLVERTDDNAILKEATAIRNGEPLSGESSFNAQGKGVAYVKPSSKNTIKVIVDRFAPMLKKNPNFFRILTYTNQSVASYNDAVRNTLGYTDYTPRVGEPIVGYSNWGYTGGRGNDATYRFINSEAYTVTKVGNPKTVHITLEDGRKIPMETVEVTIEDAMGNSDTMNLMDIRHNMANRQNATILAQEKNRLWAMANKSRGDTAAQFRGRANEITEFLFVNDNIKEGNRVLQSKVYDFGYAMTAHKSQGSTFTHVLIDDVNIQTARNHSKNDFGDMVPLEEATDTSTQDVSSSMLVSTTDDFDFDNPIPVGTSSSSQTANVRQQLEYVAVSRATDTVTIISNDVKSEDSPLNHVKEVSTASGTVAERPTAVENTPKPAVQMNSRELWEHLKSLAELLGERPVSYTPAGKTRQQYIVKDGKVYNKKGEEVHYQGKDMNKILANLAIAEDRGVIVTYKDKNYVVDNHQNITSVTSGDIMKWGPENGDRKAIIQLAEQKFKTLIENRQNRLSEMVPELMDLLKAQGINIHDKAAMEKFLKENPQWSTKIQQSVGKIQYNSQLDFAKGVRKPESIAALSSAIMSQANTQYKLTSKLAEENERTVKKIILFGNYAYLWSTENGYEFLIEKSKTINGRNYKELSEDIETYGIDESTDRVIRDIQALGDSKERVHRFVDTLRRAGAAIRNRENSKPDGQQQLDSANRTGNNGDFVADTEGQKLETSEGELYGFADSKGDLYFDEEKVSPNVQIHEYTHLWDRAVAQRNPKLWNRGVDLMKRTSLWDEVLNDANYGQKWKAMKGMTTEKMESLIASEVHSRLTGTQGEALLNKIAKEKGSKGIIAKLKQWMLDFWKELKGTFSNWSDEEINKLTLDDFNKMTVRDLIDKVNLKEQQNIQLGAELRGENSQAGNNSFQVGEQNAPFVPHPIQMTNLAKETGEAVIQVNKEWKEAELKYLDRDLGEAQELDNSAWKQSILDRINEIKNAVDRVSLPNYEFMTDKTEDTLVDAEWKIPILQDLDNQISERMAAEDYKQGEENTILKEMERILEATSEEDLYGSQTKKQTEVIQQKLGSIGEINQKINTLYESNLIPAQEVLHVAELIMNSVSDDITRLQREPGLAKQWFPTLSTELDFQNATRKQIIEAVGIDRLINAAKRSFDSSEHEYDDIATELQADLIIDNWDAIVMFGKNVFAMNEGFGLKMDYKNGGYILADGMKLGFDDFNDQQDIDSIREQVGDEQEHWQIEQRTLDILNSASEIIRMAIHDCYKIGKDGKPVVSKWGIKERVNPREAINSILTWTQGALTLDDMVNKLLEKQIQHPWLSQLTDRLRVIEGQENPNADFQSQFFTTMCRSFQSYSIVLLDNGKYAAVPVNDHPSRTEIMESITSQYNIRQHPLFLTKGKDLINLELLGNESMVNAQDFNLHKGMKELRDIFGISHSTEIGRDNNKRTISVPVFNEDVARKRLEREPLSQKELEQVIDILTATFKTLGFTPSEEVMQEIATPENIIEIASKMQFLIRDLDEARQSQLNGKTYKPFEYMGKNSIGGTLRNMLTPITDVMDEIVPNVVYDDGKLYQAYVTPSYLTLLFEKFHWEPSKFKEFIDKEYGYSEWFKYRGSGDEGWRCEWLRMLARSQEARNLFTHTVELNFNKRRYMKNMSDAEYTMSVIAHYFAEDTEGKSYLSPAWFRVPIQSNKPSSEFIKFYSHRGEGYKEKIVKGMYDMFLQEVNRIQTVRMRNLSKGMPGFIKSFDENGRKFCFLPYLNDYLSDGKKENRTLLKEKDGISAAKRNEDLAKALQNIESLKDLENDGEIRSLVMDAIESFMQQRADEILQNYEKIGIIEAAKSIKGIYPKELTKKEEQTQWVRNQLENFIWNDHYATNNILQLTIGDKAAAKDADELQKRLAELHAPGIRANVKATDYEGNRVSDGKYRTIVLKDFDGFKSNIIENLTEIFDREIEKAPDDQKEAWRAIKEDLVGKNGRFHRINVVDGQGYSSPSSYRKKALMFGKWSKQSEQIYQNLKNGDFTMQDIETAFQPLKPFVYAQLHKDMNVPNAPITSMPVPFQAKNSEYLLIMADALMQGHKTGKPNLLRAIYRVMEDSELLNPTKGIDTVQFESAIKSGLQGAVDINQFMETENGEEAAYTYMTNLMYKKDAEGNLTKEYDTTNFVQESSYETYCMQQEVPEHFKNHNQAHGSQERMIIPSDLVFAVNGETVYYEWTDPDGTHRKVDAKEFGQEYENTIAANINESVKQLKAELKIGASKKERNLALSEILQREILDSSRYGIDMFLACGLDPETGDFRVPLGDPIQAKRIEQLLNSIIKNRINKQEIAGGPIVQVTNWGTSKQLHIRFKDKDSGELLMTEEEYDKVGWSQYVSYKDYLKHRQGGIAYFEAFAPAWSKELYEKFMDKDGNIDIGAIEILNPDLLKMISYRIPTEEKYSIAPMKVVGFMPERAGDAIMFPYELTEIDDSDFDVDKRYVMRKVIEIGTRYEVKENENATEAEKSYIQHNRKSIINYLQKAVNLQGKTTAEERAKIEKDAESIAEVDRRTAERAHQERLDAIERRNALIEDAEAKAEFSKNEEKNFDIWDKRADKQESKYNKAVEKENARYQVELDRINDRKNDTILKEITKLENQKVREKINQFLTIDRWNNSSQDDALTRQLRIAYLRYMHPTYEPTTGKIANDNKIIDMTWGVLTNEAIAPQLLNPGGFDNFKKIGYMIAAFKNPNDTHSWEELEKMSVEKLQDLHHSKKDLAWIDTQVEYYRQNAAAASLISIFAVNKIAHAMLERDNLQIDVEKFCGENPFTIAGKEFSGLIDVDPTFDDKGKLVGKTIGSGVSASADAAKTPALHLMNVNLSTVNIFTTLLRLGMPDETAGLFCSQNVISEVLDEFNRKNLNNYEPLDNIIEQRLIKLRKENAVSENANINNEELTKKELIAGLTDGKHPETDYKVLLAYQKIRSLADAMRKPTFATRFNSISSAVGPQIIDNLILEHKMEQFGQTDDETGFYSADGATVAISDLFDMHPVLGAFAQSVNIAKILFQEMPTGSNSFRQLLSKLPGGLVEKFFSDKKLLSDLNNFYQSYLLVNEGMIDTSELKDYLEKFPKEFTEKGTDGKTIQERYPDNALIQNIRLTSSKKTGRTFLTIKLTGEDETKKDAYRTAWIDLHKKNPELSQKLFRYFFFRAGIGFSPKTGMALVPTFVKERLSTTTAEGKRVTYSDVYRKLAPLKEKNDIVIDQFIRNNWNESKLVPKKGGEGTNYQVDLKEGRLVAYTEEDVADLRGVTYMRTYHDGQTYLWKLIGSEDDAENQNHRVYKRIKPLGDNNEYLEMSTEEIVDPYNDTKLDIEDNDTSDLESKSNAEVSAAQTVQPKIPESQVSKAMADFAEAMVKQWESSNYKGTTEDAIARINNIKEKGNEKQFAKFFVNVYKQMGLDLSEEDAVKEFKKLC